jgi:hypothetical protein
MSGAVPTRPLYVFMACRGTALHFVFTLHVTCVFCAHLECYSLNICRREKRYAQKLQRRSDACRLPNMAWPGLDLLMTGTDGKMLSTW